jgi:hypothetical protein
VDTNAGTAFCTQSSVLLIAGKGGVGKSTLSATVSKLAGRHALSALLVRLEDGGGPSWALAHRVRTDESELFDDEADDLGFGSVPIRTQTITPDEALIKYLVAHGFGRAAKRLAKSNMLNAVATAIPGIRDVLALGEVVQLERSHAADLIVVDGPAAGRATTFLTSAQGVFESSRAGPIRSLAAEVVGFLSDPARCQVVLVTLAEETPVNETVETAHTLEDQVGMHLGPVVVNCLYRQLDHLDVDPGAAAAAAGVALRNGEAAAIRAAASFRRGRQEMQAEQVSRLAEALLLPQLLLPDLFVAEIGLPEIDRLVDAFETGIEHLANQCAARDRWV